MTRKQKQIGAALGVAAIVAFTSWPLYQYFRVQAATAARRAQAQARVDQNPQLKAQWDAALSDDVVTEEEVVEILAQSDAPAEAGK